MKKYSLKMPKVREKTFKRYLPFSEVPEWFEELAVRPDGLLQLLHWIYSCNAVGVVLPVWK